MELKELLAWVQQTEIRPDTAEALVSRLPDVIYEAEKKLEIALDRKEMKRLFVETMEAGIIAAVKEANPKIPEYQLRATAAEQLHEERRDLLEDESVVRKWEATLRYLQNKSWSAKTVLAKMGENIKGG